MDLNKFTVKMLKESEIDKEFGTTRDIDTEIKMNKDEFIKRTLITSFGDESTGKKIWDSYLTSNKSFKEFLLDLIDMVKSSGVLPSGGKSDDKIKMYRDEYSRNIFGAALDDKAAGDKLYNAYVSSGKGLKEFLLDVIGVIKKSGVIPAEARQPVAQPVPEDNRYEELLNNLKSL